MEAPHFCGVSRPHEKGDREACNPFASLNTVEHPQPRASPALVPNRCRAAGVSAVG